MREKILASNGDVTVQIDESVDVPSKAVVLRDYASACLTPLESVADTGGGYDGVRPKNSKFLLSLIGEEPTSILFNSIVIIPGIGGSPCSGMLVKVPNSEEKLGLLTAAHCAGSIDKSDYPKKSTVTLNISRNFVFDDIRGQRTFVRVNRPNRSIQYDPINDDIALLILDGNDDPSKRGIEIGNKSLKPFEHIYIIGQNELLREHRDGLRKSLANQDTRPQAFAQSSVPSHNTVITMGALCRAHGQLRSLLLHNCQTRWGTSGATILSIVDRRVFAVGVHTGNHSQFNATSKSLNGEELRKIKATMARNYGIVLGEK
jgi:hypothetical protein